MLGTMMEPVPTASASPLVGRSNELGRLSSAVGLAPGAGSASGSVLLAGDAGVGKTRLLAELRDRARDRRLARRRRALPRLRRQRAALPARSPRRSAGSAAESPALARLRRRRADPPLERLQPGPAGCCAGGTGAAERRTDRG